MTDAEFQAELRASLPASWAQMTPAKRRVLNYLVEHGPTHLWPVAVLRSLPLLRRLQAVGHVERLNRLTAGLTVWHITPQGRAALGNTPQGASTGRDPLGAPDVSDEVPGRTK